MLEVTREQLHKVIFHYPSMYYPQGEFFLISLPRFSLTWISIRHKRLRIKQKRLRISTSLQLLHILRNAVPVRWSQRTKFTNEGAESIFKKKNMTIFLRGGAVVSATASQQEGHGFNFATETFLCGVWPGDLSIFIFLLNPLVFHSLWNCTRKLGLEESSL